MFGGLVETLRDTVGDGLRSVTVYSRNDYEVLYMREDVAADYTDAEIEAGVEELRLQTVEQPHLNDIFRAHHGELRCELRWFAEAVEMNFPIEDGRGIAVAIDATHYTAQNTLITELCEIIDNHAEDLN